jgi:predicted DNA-binding protein
MVIGVRMEPELERRLNLLAYQWSRPRWCRLR